MNIAIAIIEHPLNGSFLIAQRRSDVHLADFWEFPGGKCMPGESLQHCVVRETMEEVGLSVWVVEEWPSLEYTYPGLTVTLFPFLCHSDSIEARPLGNRKVEWVHPSDLDMYAFPDANIPLIRRLQSRRFHPRPGVK